MAIVCLCGLMIKCDPVCENGQNRASFEYPVFVKYFKVDIVLAPVTNVNGYFTGTSPSFAGLSNKPVMSRRARVGTRPICPEHSTLGHASSRFPSIQL